MLVSIYIPTKNRLEMLKASVNAALRQTYESIELIIVDDASTDGTQKYLNELIKVDRRVRIYRNEISKGANHARNIAIKSSQGAFVTGLDDDDEFLENHVSALVDFWILLSKHSTEKISCIYPQNIYRHGTNLTTSNKPSRVECHDLFLTNYVGNQIFAPRSHFIDAGLFDEQMPAWQDLEFFFRVLKKFGSARLLDIPTYVFDITPRDDRVSVGKKNKILQACELMGKLHAFDNPRALQKLLLQAHANHYNFNTTIFDFMYFAKQGLWLSGYQIMISKVIHTIVLKLKLLYWRFKTKIQSKFITLN